MAKEEVLMDEQYRELLRTMRKAKTKRKKFRRRKARKVFANFKAMEAKLDTADKLIANLKNNLQT